MNEAFALIDGGNHSAAGAHLHDDQMISLPSSQSRGEGGIQGFGRKAVNENVWVHERIMGMFSNK